MDGYLDINSFLKIDGIETINSLNKLIMVLEGYKDIKIESYDEFLEQMVISFMIGEELYYFKYTKRENIYNELVVQEIAKDMGIDCLDYRLAILGNFRGLISKNFKKDNCRYIYGKELLIECYGKKYRDITRSYTERNNILDIWIALEERYKGRNNKDSIVYKIVCKLIKVFILDMMVGQYDRHSSNWGIIEYDNGNVDIQPLYDNTRCLYYEPDEAQILLKVDDWEYSSLDINLTKFINSSSAFFIEMLKNYLWIINKENINEILKRIEDRTRILMSDEDKNYYRDLLLKYYNFFMNRLNDNIKVLIKK